MNTIVVGGGKVGIHLAGLLLAGGHQIRLIETRTSRISFLHNAIPQENILHGSGTDPAVLEAAGINQTQVLAIVTGSDETNLVVASLARFEFKVPRIIARVNNPKNAWMFTKEMGVDVALNQADLMAQLIQEEMSLGDMMVLLKLRKGQYSVVEEKIADTASIVGKAISELGLPTQCLIAAIIRKGELIIPRGETILQPADELLAIAHASQFAALTAILGRDTAKK